MKNILKVSGKWNGRRLAGALALTFAAGAVGGLFAMHAGDVYSSLLLPPFAPPASLFSPVWTVLYLLAGLAFYRILLLPPSAARRKALFYYALQLIFNAVWPLLFFTLGLRLAALLDLVILLVYTALAARNFHRLDKAAGLLMLPYVLWLVFAVLLNGGVVWLNG